MNMDKLVKISMNEAAKLLGISLQEALLNEEAKSIGFKLACAAMAEEGANKS